MAYWKQVCGWSCVVLMVVVFSVAGCGGEEHRIDTVGPNCGDDEAQCGESCVDLGSSRDHCGGCGISCGTFEVCDAGQCVVSCPSTQDVCEGACYDLETSGEHCGECGNECGEGLFCVDGACEAGCGDELAKCDGVCRDTDHDPNHCGACGESCGEGEACLGGECVPDCPGGQEICDGLCYDLMSSPLHCGECGTFCPSGEVCLAGGCMASCGQGLDECGGVCRDFENDPMHCGDCDNECPDAPNALGICSGGDCALACEAGFSNCDGHTATGCETAGGCANRYRRTVSIENTTNQALEDFQVRLVIDTMASVSMSTMRPDCGDLRFFEEDQFTAIPYWIEEGCATEETTVWLRLASLEANESQTVYMRYGDPLALSAADGHAVFDAFDDFSEDSSGDYDLYNNPAWNGGEFIWHPADGLLRTDESNDDFYLIRTDTASFDENFWVETRAFTQDDDGYGATVLTEPELFWTCVTTNDYNGATRVGEDGLVRHNGVPDAHEEAEQLLGFGNVNNPEGRWGIASTAFDGSRFYCAYDYQRQAQSYDLGSGNVVGLGLASFANDPAAEYDWWRVRKFTAQEPVVSVGGEETLF